jgi:hypothetical protein
MHTLMKSLFFAALISLTVPLCCSCGFGLLLKLSDLPSTLQTLDIGNDYVVTIKTQKIGFDVGTPDLLFYVRCHGSNITPPDGFSMSMGSYEPPEHLRFGCVKFANEKLVGVFEQKHPHFLVLIVDTENSEIWPVWDASSGFPLRKIKDEGEQWTKRVRQASGDDRYRCGLFEETE